MTTFQVDILEIHKNKMGKFRERILSSHKTKSGVKIFDKSNLHMPSYFTIASAMVIYDSKLPLGACSIRACSFSKLRK